MVGQNSIIINHAGKQVQVSSLNENVGDLIKVDEVYASVIYDLKYSGKIYIMCIINSFYLNYINITLLSSFMIILAGVEVYECPDLLVKTPSIYHHSVHFK